MTAGTCHKQICRALFVTFVLPMWISLGFLRSVRLMPASSTFPNFVAVHRLPRRPMTDAAIHDAKRSIRCKADCRSRGLSATRRIGAVGATWGIPDLHGAAEIGHVDDKAR